MTLPPTLSPTLIERAAQPWLGSAFALGGGAGGPGGTVDCVHFAWQLYAALGLPLPAIRETYRLQGSNPGADLPEALAARGLIQLALDTRGSQCGDLLVFSQGMLRIPRHCGVLADPATGRFFHAIRKAGVTTGTLHDPTWHVHLHSIWRHPHVFIW